MKVVLISTYELGRQPFGLASPAAWLKERGHDVMCVDLAIATLPALPIREAQLVALYLPMHTATRLAAQVIPKVRLLNPKVHLCAYGLYAPVNAGYLKKLGVETILGGEFEQALADLAERVGKFSERINKMRNESALTGAEMAYLAARVADIVVRYIDDPDEQRAFVQDLIGAMGRNGALEAGGEVSE